jgi:hypothetical protein
LANLKFLNIRNLKQFIEEIQRLHLLRIYSDENQLTNSFTSFHGKEIKPSADFFQLIHLLEESAKNDFSNQTKKKVLSWIMSS